MIRDVITSYSIHYTKLYDQLFEEFKTIANEQKREVGKVLNVLKTQAQEKINELREAQSSTDQSASGMDLSAPGTVLPMGSRHPLSIVKNEIVDIFARLGFNVAVGPEIEDDHHVFTALNFPPEHPARDMQDTFFIATNPDVILRTHTSYNFV